jgi:Tfp pilus assembly protein PilF
MDEPFTPEQLTQAPPSVLQQKLAAAFAAHQQGRYEQAEAGYFDVLEEMPNHADALHLLGLVGKARGNYETAEKLIRRAIEVRPNFASQYYNLGNLLCERSRFAEAAQAYRDALRHQPNYPEAYYAIGNLERDAGQLEAADQAFAKAYGQKPSYYEAKHNRANVLRELGRAEEAVALLREVLEQVPDLAEAHYNLALSLFTLGRYVEGGPHYEWRWKSKGFTSPARGLTQPKWNGQPLPHSTLLLYAEQGLGDTLQFIRYLELAKARVGQVLVEVPAPLHRLLTRSLGHLATFIKQGQSLPPFDVQLPLLSLHGLFDAACPPAYLQAEPEKLAAWQQALGHHTGLTVGINWQGNPNAKVDKGRSLPLRLLAPLSQIPAIRLVSLQKNAGIEQLASLPAGMRVVTLGENYDAGPDAFLDAAAVLKALDVFVTTDTALAHLAGALGVKTALLLKAVPDWRWGLSGGLTHWYKTLYLFRQPEPGNWDSAITALASWLQSCHKKPSTEGG